MAVLSDDGWSVESQTVLYNINYTRSSLHCDLKTHQSADYRDPHCKEFRCTSILSVKRSYVAHFD